MAVNSVPRWSNWLGPARKGWGIQKMSVNVSRKRWLVGSRQPEPKRLRGPISSVRVASGYLCQVSGWKEGLWPGPVGGGSSTPAPEDLGCRLCESAFLNCSQRKDQRPHRCPGQGRAGLGTAGAERMEWVCLSCQGHLDTYNILLGLCCPGC